MWYPPGYEQPCNVAVTEIIIIHSGQSGLRHHLSVRHEVVHVSKHLRTCADDDACVLCHEIADVDGLLRQIALQRLQSLV